MEWLVTLHSYWRWVVLLLGIAAIVLGFMAASGNRPWDTTSERLSLAFTIALDIQALIGIILWISESRWTGDLYLGWAHPLGMLAALAVAHIGRARSDRASTDRDRGRTVATFFLISFVIILIAIPLGAWPV